MGANRALCYPDESAVLFFLVKITWLADRANTAVNRIRMTLQKEDARDYRLTGISGLILVSNNK